tara:strand:+ start:958 stop:1302 length:345 start_codon:yes stop_codon:yes gene_type:complete
MKKIILTGTLILCLFSFKKDSTIYKQVDCNEFFLYIQNRQLEELKELARIIEIDHEINEISTALAVNYLAKLKPIISLSHILTTHYHATFKEEHQPFQIVSEGDVWCECIKKLQ